jgi:hypothetical protein
LREDLTREISRSTDLKMGKWRPLTGEERMPVLLPLKMLHKGNRKLQHI